MRPVSSDSRPIASALKLLASIVVILLLIEERVLAVSTSIFDPASYNSDSIADVFYLVLAITGLIFVIVFGAIVAFVLRFRARDADDDSEPPQIYGSWPIEVAWTITPVLIIFVLFLIVIRSVNEQRPERAPQDALKVRVVGHQWWWSFEYPELGFITANELHVPLGEADHPRSVFLDLESADVVHSFWVPRLGGKTDLVPNRVNTMRFEPRIAGTFYGQCAEYCGTQHAKMLLRVVVESEQDFHRWAENEMKPAVNDPTVATGRSLFLTLSCANCHTIRGTSARGTVGPDLTHLMSRQTLAAGAAPNNHESLTAWIQNPKIAKAGCHMPNMKLNDSQVASVVSYLETLR